MAIEAREAAGVGVGRRLVRSFPSVMLGALWSGVLLVIALWLLGDAAVRFRTVTLEIAVLGVCAAASSQLVFSSCVAGPLFPKADRLIGPFVEIPSCVILVTGFVWLGVRAALSLV